MKQFAFIQRLRFAAIVCIVLLAALQIAGAQNQPVFRIGVLDNPRGPIANGARLAVEGINNSGGVRGADGTYFRLELVIEPSNFGANLENAVANLREASVIAVLGPKTNEEVLNGMTLLQSLNVPVLTPAIDDTILTSDTSGRLLRTRAQEVLHGQTLAGYLINEFGLRRIATVQLDVASTTGMIGFTTSALDFGVTPQPTLLLEDVEDLPNFATALTNYDPDAIVAYGSPALAGTLYADLRASGWQGLFAYPDADDTLFRGAIPVEQLTGIISVTTWPFSAIDPVSDTFLDAYVRTFGELPGAVQAASYDAITLIAQAIQQPGELRANLLRLNDVRGIQGLLRPAELSSGETSANVAVTRLGSFGAPEVLARYEGAQRLPGDLPVFPTPTPPAPAATPTPQGVVITIANERQNVRSGPSMQYDILGQLPQGTQFPVIGASIDYTWVVINFRGQYGWLATYLLDVWGDLSTVPIIPPPPTPTPGFTATPTTAPEADLVIDNAIAAPSPINPNINFTVTVTVRNAGLSPSGPFAVAGTFPPNNVYLPALAPSLAPGQSMTVNLNGILTNTGTYTTTLVVDVNNQVPERVFGEMNNLFNFTYTVDKTVRNTGTQTLNLGDTIELEGDLVQGDANWNADGGLGLDGIFGGKLGLIAAADISAIHWDLINPAVINRDSISRIEFNPGSLIGVITADGSRAVLRVDNVSDTQLTVTFRTYHP